MPPSTKEDLYHFDGYHNGEDYEQNRGKHISNSTSRPEQDQTDKILNGEHVYVRVYTGLAES